MLSEANDLQKFDNIDAQFLERVNNAQLVLNLKFSISHNYVEIESLSTWKIWRTLYTVSGDVQYILIRLKMFLHFSYKNKRKICHHPFGKRENYLNSLQVFLYVAKTACHTF